MIAGNLRKLLVIAIVAAAAGCHGRREAGVSSPAPAVAVRAVVVEEKPYAVVEEVIGTVRAKVRAAVEAKVSGRIARMAVDLGEAVKAGDLIAEVDAREVRARLDQALATREQAEQDLRRYTTLLQKQVAARQEFDAAQARFRVADAAVKEAEAMLGYIEVRAPFAGVVSRRLADAGDFAAPGKPLVEIEDPAALRFEAAVPEALIATVRRGETITVRIPSIGTEFAGTVAEIAPAGDPGSRTFLVRIDLPPSPRLRPGQFGRAAVPVGEKSSLRVPSGALVTRGQMEMVFVVEDAVARLRLVKAGKRIGDEVEILSGIERGERVVRDGAGALADGQPVKVEP